MGKDTRLILYHREQNPDVHFSNPDQWTVFGGLNWTVFGNAVKGAVKTSGASSSLILTTTPLKPATTYKYIMSVASSVGGTLDLVLGGTTQSIPNTAVPVLYTGKITTGSTGAVVITGSSTNATTIRYLKIVQDPDNVEIDLSTSLDVALTYNIADIRDIGFRDTNFSKTITIPGTKTNNKFFDQIFEIEQDGYYLPGKKRRAIVLDGGEEVFNGVVQLKKINRINNGLNNYSLVSYEITLLGGLSGFAYELGDKLLTDLDFTEYNHPYNAQRQNESWWLRIMKNGANYTNWVNGANLTITTATYTATGVKFTFNAAHGLAVGDNLLIPPNSGITSQNLDWYVGDHVVRSVPSSTEVIVFYSFLQFAANQTSYTFSATAYKHEPTGEGYFYPMINYGQTSGYVWQVNQFYPGIYLYEYIVKMFKEANYIFDSSILTSSDFKRLILSYGGEGKLRPDEIIDRTFRVEFLGTDVATTAPQDGQYYTVRFDNDSTSPNFNGSGAFDLANDEWVVPNSGAFKLTTNLFLKKSTGGIDTGLVEIQFFNVTTNTVLGNVVIPRSNISTSFSNLYFTLGPTNCNLISGQVVRVRINNYNIGSPARTITVGTGSSFYAEVQNSFYQEGDTFNVNNAVPRKIKCVDLFKSIVKAFKLIIQPDTTNDRKLIIESEDDFYSSGTDVDWTDKLATDRDIEQYPIGELNYKNYHFNYLEDKDYLNQDHLGLYKKIYGNRVLTVDNDFIKESYSTDLIFSPTVLQEFPPLSQRIISSISNDVIDPNKPIYIGNPRILYTRLSGGLNSNGTWQHGSYTNDYYYGYAGHLDKAVPRVGVLFGVGPRKDLNWDFPIATYFEYGAWTDRNLYNEYHKQGMDQITDKDSKIITCWLYLKPSDISKLDFRNRFIIDGHFLRLNKAIDWVPNPELPTQCEFILFKTKPPFVPTYTANPSFGVDDPGDINGSEMMILRNQNNSSNQISSIDETIQINGQGNQVSNLDTSNVQITGSNNVVNQNSENINIKGSNNFIAGGVSNIELINCNNCKVYAPNVKLTNCDNVTVPADVDNFMGEGLYSVTLTSGFTDVNINIDEGSITTITQDTTTSLDKKKYLIDASSPPGSPPPTNINIYLFAPPFRNFTQWFKKIDASSNTVTIQSIVPGVTIEGASNHILTTRYDDVALLWTGTEWLIDS